MKKSGRFVFLGITLCLLTLGCSGKETALNLDVPARPSAQTGRIVFPNGLITGAASQRQATQLAKILVESHNMAVAQRRRMAESVSANTQQLKELDQAHRQNRDSARLAYQLLQDMASRQKTGEITIFWVSRN